jgi:hypothetical protein
MQPCREVSRGVRAPRVGGHSTAAGQASRCHPGRGTSPQAWRHASRSSRVDARETCEVTRLGEPCAPASSLQPAHRACLLSLDRALHLFHGKRHPSTLGGGEVQAFLEHLAIERNVAASTQSQALAALLLLYGEVLAISVERYVQLPRPRRPERLPVVLSPGEIAAARRASGNPIA